MKFLLIFLLIFSDIIYAQENNKQLALIIGNGNYTYTAKVSNAENDVVLITEALESCNFKTIAGKNCTKYSLEILCDSFLSEVKSCETALIYYCGHGVNIKGINYIIPVDADENSAENFETEFFNFDSLIYETEKLDLEFNIVINDAFRANRFLNNDIRAGFETYYQPDNFCFVHSATPSSVCCHTYSEKDLFSHIFIKYLNEKNIELNNFFKRIRYDVYKISDEKQSVYIHNSLKKEFYFRIE